MKSVINWTVLILVFGFFWFVSYFLIDFAFNIFGFQNKGFNFFTKTEDSSYTLYMNSEAFPDMRIHIANFNADEDKSYNEENCSIAARFFQLQINHVNYWCEEGR